MQCVNCETETEGKFCPNCGQRTGVKRITFREGWNDFWARIYGFDGMFPRTLRDLSIRPGTATREFLRGNRTKYYGPVGYFFLMITLLYLVASLLGIDIIDFLRSATDNGFQSAPKKGSGQEKVMENVLRIVSDNMKLVTFIYIPIQAFSTRYVFFRKSGFNYLEHTILPFYVQGHIYWLSIISLFYYSFTDYFIPNWVAVLISLLFASFAFMNFFTHQSRLKAFLKGVGVYVFSYFLFMILVVFGVILYFILNPEALEMIRPSNNR
jgi:Protein of unknown function (DUF3667).